MTAILRYMLPKESALCHRQWFIVYEIARILRDTSTTKSRNDQVPHYDDLYLP